jgi:hypothetical protein
MPDTVPKLDIAPVGGNGDGDVLTLFAPPHADAKITSRKHQARLLDT